MTIFLLYFSFLSHLAPIFHRHFLSDLELIFGSKTQFQY
jgi:hypothetical protein